MKADMEGMTMFPTICEAAGLPAPVAEYRFAPPRLFRFDWCWVEQRLALEIEGGVWVRGRHTRPTGFLRDVEKYNLAAILGYRVLRCTPKEFKSGAVLATIQQALEVKAG